MSHTMKYKIGQIVRLKSGGPEMTVQDESSSNDKTKTWYSCQWFAGKKLESGNFPPESLELVQAEVRT